jgi:hypothetical protein
MKRHILVAAFLTCVTGPESAFSENTDQLEACHKCSKWPGTCETFETPTYTVCPASAARFVAVEPPWLHPDGSYSADLGFRFFVGQLEDPYYRVQEIQFDAEPSTVAGVTVVTNFYDSLWRNAGGDVSQREHRQGDARGTCDYRGSQVRCEVTVLNCDVPRHSDPCDKNELQRHYLITYRLLAPAPPIEPFAEKRPGETDDELLARACARSWKPGCASLSGPR